MFSWLDLCFFDFFFLSLNFITSCGRRQWHPTPVLLPGKSHGRRRLVGCSPWGLEESDTTERLHFHFPLSCIGEGNGNPLQCSCLENPRDGGPWWAAVSGVTQSRIWLRRQQQRQQQRLYTLPVYELCLHRWPCLILPTTLWVKESRSILTFFKVKLQFLSSIMSREHQGFWHDASVPALYVNRVSSPNHRLL